MSHAISLPRLMSASGLLSARIINEEYNNGITVLTRRTDPDLG